MEKLRVEGASGWQPAAVKFSSRRILADAVLGRGGDGALDGRHRTQQVVEGQAGF